jgi:hypothetical protein
MADTQAYQKAKFITLKSLDECTFVLDSEVACHSKMIKARLEALEDPVDNMEIPFDGITAVVLDVVCQFLHERHIKGEAMPEFSVMSTFDPAKDEDKKKVIDIMVAADFLDC